MDLGSPARAGPPRKRRARRSLGRLPHRNRSRNRPRTRTVFRWRRTCAMAECKSPMPVKSLGNVHRRSSRLDETRSPSTSMSKGFLLLDHNCPANGLVIGWNIHSFSGVALNDERARLQHDLSESIVFGTGRAVEVDKCFPGRWCLRSSWSFFRGTNSIRVCVDTYWLIQAATISCGASRVAISFYVWR